jgi:sugar/nucleoside kinase (ribokinase family)
MITASTVYLLDQRFDYPLANHYAEIAQTFDSVGGEAVNSAIMLSKFGIKTRLDGNWLNSLSSLKTLSLLKPFNIDTSRLLAKPDYGTREFVITDKTSRTVFGNYAQFHNGEKQWNDPVEDDIRHAKMVVLDPYFRNESEYVARLCVQHAIPYVTLDCKFDSYMAQHAAALIISHELRDQAYPGRDMSEIFAQYQAGCSGLIISTFGDEKIWYARRNQDIRYYTPYKIKPLDTTGAGDSFRAGITYGLMNGWDDAQTIDFASAVAACVCLTIPHALNAPDLDSILAFMEQYRT